METNTWNMAIYYTCHTVLNMLLCTVKHVLSGHSKIDKIKVLMENGSLMKAESIVECSLGAFCNTFDLY